MAQKSQAPTLAAVAMFIFIFAAATPLVSCQTLDAIYLNGTICCTTTGNCGSKGRAARGVRASVTFTNVLRAVGDYGQFVVWASGQTVHTDGSGAFKARFTDIQDSLGDMAGKILPLAAVVNLPINQRGCPALRNAGDGILIGVPKHFRTVSTHEYGLVGYFEVPEFVHRSSSG